MITYPKNHTEHIPDLHLTDSNSDITVTASAMTLLKLDESNPSNEISYDSGSCLYEPLGNGTWCVAGRGDLKGSSLTIRPDIGGVAITEIAAGAFLNDTELKYVKIPPNITRIGSGAFKGTGLEDVEFEDTQYMVIFFKNLGEWAQVCVQYTYTDDTGEKWNGGWPGETMELFNADQNIYSCKVPLSINMISFNCGDDEFQTEQMQVTDIREDLSYNLFSPKDINNSPGQFFRLNRERYNPGTSYVKYNGLQIGNSAFEGCEGITEITLPRRAVNIGSSAFKNCANLTKISNPVQNRLLQIGDNAFENCSNLVFVTLETGLREIRRYAFNRCSVLSGVRLGSALKLIDSGAFLDCPDFQTVTIPASVTQIGPQAFDFTERPEGSWSRYVMFENPYTWFVSTGDIPGLEKMELLPPAELYAASMNETGVVMRNGNKLSLTYAAYFWHRLDKMLPPKISRDGDSLHITDELGVAEVFKIYANGVLVKIIDPIPPSI